MFIEFFKNLFCHGYIKTAQVFHEECCNLKMYVIHCSYILVLNNTHSDYMPREKAENVLNRLTMLAAEMQKNIVLNRNENSSLRGLEMPSLLKNYCDKTSG